MRLYHYSAAPFVLDPTRAYRQDPRNTMPMKPTGLWLSVESDDADSFGWREWCEREEFQLSRLTYRTELLVQPDAKVLHLDRTSALLAFTRRYEMVVEGFSFLKPIDWSRVAQDYRGLIIAPYDWDLRLDLHWYYAWDCASACIWDCTTLSTPSA